MIGIAAVCWRGRGDALGAAIEFDDIATIHRRFGPAGIVEPAEAYGRVGAITDDTQMTLFTAEGVLQSDDRLERGVGYPPANLWFAYQRWLRTQGFTDPWPASDPANLHHGELHLIKELWSRRAPGNTCLSALRSPIDFDSAGVFPIAANDSKGCGGVMRAAPCGLTNWDDWDNLREQHAFKLGVASAALTHGHPSGHLAAGAFALIIRRLCDGRPLTVAVDAAIGILAAQDEEEVLGALERARELAASGPPADVASLGEGWVAEEALAIAVYCALMHPDDFAAAVRLAANHSGDSDSTAAITGNIMGAVLGVGAIPAGWLDVLELRETIERLATAMHDRFVLRRRDVDWKRWNYAAEPDYEAPAAPHDAYWVSPGRLLAGPYPGAKDRAQAEGKLNDFLDLGVTCFIDLTEEGELEPYGELLRTLAARRGTEVAHVRMPICDVDVPPAERMREIQEAITGALAGLEMVYVHCWGGVGRTGTVIGCYLVQNEGHTGEEALATLERLRASTQRAHRQSPETSQQRDIVRTWNIEALNLVSTEPAPHDGIETSARARLEPHDVSLVGQAGLKINANTMTLYHDPDLTYGRPTLIGDLLGVPATTKNHQLENQATSVLAWLIDRSPTIARAVLRLFLGEHPPDTEAAIAARTQLSLPKPDGGALRPDLSICVAGRALQLLIEVKVDSTYATYDEFGGLPQDTVYRDLWRPLVTGEAAVRAVGTLTRTGCPKRTADPNLLIARDVTWRELRDTLDHLRTHDLIDPACELVAESFIAAIEDRIAPEPPADDLQQPFFRTHQPVLDKVKDAITERVSGTGAPKQIRGTWYFGWRIPLPSANDAPLFLRLYLAAQNTRLNLPRAPDSLIAAPERDADGTIDKPDRGAVEAAGFPVTKSITGDTLHRHLWPLASLDPQTVANQIVAMLRKTGLLFEEAIKSS